MDGVEDSCDSELNSVKVAGAANIDASKIETRVPSPDTCHLVFIITVLERIIVVINRLSNILPKAFMNQEMISKILGLYLSFMESPKFDVLPS